MMNCINFLDKITKIQDLNKDISAKTSFNKTIITSIKNENNDNSYLIVALHCLGNYLHSEAGITFLKLKIIDIYSLLKNLQSKYYSNAGILININYISGAIIMNCEDKNHSKLFFDLVADSIKCQDWNSNLIKMALKIMNDSLEKKPFMVDVVNEQLISNMPFSSNAHERLDTDATFVNDSNDSNNIIVSFIILIITISLIFFLR